MLLPDRSIAGALFSGTYSDTLCPPAGCFKDGFRFANGMGTDGTSPLRLMRTALGLCTGRTYK